ncbi:class I SAM-dependent methyltransferase [Mucilaginibacter mali]|uniref:Class I SAM-dependent methyltransferase n=1 Tax=Mucilaginibacter mali TaxID=2740462 RepID=A0A7D4UK20_9SPHI|nr:class I SAM-dependent methyltransferase [Mucilaginibacter mali]QKJ29922.1 class I SAM-dependent methyltransferase [Mucilaginibacter mali]
MVGDQLTSEELAGDAFNRQSVIFDTLYGANTIISYKRGRVRQHIAAYLKPNSYILELNSGTGEDAMFFATQGHTVHATDISTGMQEVLQQKVNSAGLNTQISNELCSFTNLVNLESKGPYDAIFSNFGGLNCTGELDKVLSSLSPLLKSGGTVTMVIIPSFCLWETLLAFKGKFRTATRRFFSRNGRIAHIEGQYFKCFYYSPQYVINQTKADFVHLNTEGLCTIVPPSYIEGFAEKHPKKYQWLKKWEGRLKGTWPWKHIGDYFIITLQKR